MNRVRICLTFAAVLFTAVPGCLAQETNAFESHEARLAGLFNQLSKALNDGEKEMICDALLDDLDTLLLQPAFFYQPLDSLRTLGKVRSPDDRLRFYTWNLPYHDGTNRFYGMLQFRDDPDETPVVFRLKDVGDHTEEPLQAVFQGNDWYGSLVYDIVQADSGDTTIYILLGYTPYNFFISKRIIDVLYFQRENIDGQLQPVFGKPVFLADETLQCRVVFAYAAKAQMALQWNARADMIVFDHLSPYDPSYVGNYQYYGPDFSYDGFIYENNLWRLVKDIDIRNIQE